MAYWITGRDAVTGEPGRMLSDADTPDAARAQAASQGLLADKIIPADEFPPEPAAETPPPPGRPRVRPWVVAVTLFASGFASRLTFDVLTNSADSYPYAIVFQTFAYAGGLFALFVWWQRAADVGSRGALGCVGWLLAALASLIAVVTSCPK